MGFSGAGVEAGAGAEAGAGVGGAVVSEQPAIISIITINIAIRVKAVLFIFNLLDIQGFFFAILLLLDTASPPSEKIQEITWRFNGVNKRNTSFGYTTPNRYTKQNLYHTGYIKLLGLALLHTRL
jgi:hypothetical protein